MSQSNTVITTHDNQSSPISTKKPLAFVQPRIRDINATENQIDNKPDMSFIPDEPFSYVSQSRKQTLNRMTSFNLDKK
ncbi:unnamed protein product [Adineta steineri]|uniref:Uncharacterized protein n=2 Tax=Adineta steineri TaxID=433720 RepID=A0A815DPS9_9BILA|nr:unnamed protein product [Adineta steineri]CAF1300651.1 unnamed protein product [Adineta steineri]CAF1385104.1 unnamed protein product [Adineta steineri]CAF3484077.1 unnamed protein product [Adineta steineri]CAF3602205.1 unnamed protein product [Adineta steineri]